MAALDGAGRDRVVVVLVRARNPSNIGAVARAMHDFGFSRLRIVNDFPAPLEAARSAVDAAQVIARAEVCANVAEAVADCTLVVGTTAVGQRDLEHPLLSLAEAAPRIRIEAAAAAGPARVARVAILFGSEKTGLSNEELSHCNLLMTIPMQEHEGMRHPSMNLGQAAAVCLYELVRTAAGAAATAPGISPQAANGAELERLTTLLGEVMEATGYRRRHPANSGPAHIRRMVRQMGIGADAEVWMGILRQILWNARASKPGGEAGG